MIAIDTSVAIKWVVPETRDHSESHTDLALSLLERGLVAPDLMLAEFGNALWKKVRRREIGQPQAMEAMRVLPDIVSMLPSGAYAARALEIAFVLDHPVYDCFFLSVAEQHDCQLVTADRRLVSRCSDTLYAPLIVELTTRSWH